MQGLHGMSGVLSYVMNLVYVDCLYVEGCGTSSGEYCVPLVSV